MQRAGPKLVLSGGGREHSGLAAVLSLPIGVDGCENQIIGYTCRCGVRTIFGQGFNSPRLHQNNFAQPRASNVRGDSSLPPVNIIVLARTAAFPKIAADRHLPSSSL